MLFRRARSSASGPFDERLPAGGDEEDWLRRLKFQGGQVVYLAAAGLDHRRAGDDARLRSLMRSAYHRGRNLRAYDERRGVAPAWAASCGCWPAAAGTPCAAPARRGS